MNLLIDTHILIWALSDRQSLSEHAIEMILSEGNEVYVSSATLWEIAIKHAKHPEQISVSGEEMARMALHAGFLLIDISVDDVISLETLRQKDGSTHRDPFDRILIAQAKNRGMKLMTHDSKMSDYLEPCIKLV